MKLTAIIEREGDGYVALLLECASAGEVAGRLSSEIYITQIEVLPRVGCALRTNRR